MGGLWSRVAIRKIPRTTHSWHSSIERSVSIMYTPIPTGTSCATTWLSAANKLKSEDVFNMILDIEDPVSHSDADNEIINTVDQFLIRHDQNPIATVANTICPWAMYRRYGVPNIYEKYLEAFDALTESKRWGRYFERMIRHRDRDAGEFNPLQRLIEKLQHCTRKGSAYKSVYELSIYDPARDSKPYRGSQCLSFLSFKLSDNKLLLTAMYRNHTYITRCLGNLIGLGRLMHLVANEVGISVGSLTIVSTHAELDTGNWGKMG